MAETKETTMRVAILLSAFVFASCATSDLLSYDSLQREQLARESHEAAEVVKELVVDCAPDVVEEVTKAVEAIQENTVDQVARARIVQKLNNAKPQKLPALRSPEDDAKVNALAGKAEDKEAMRRKAKELPGKVGAGVAWVVRKMIPRWLLWAIGIGTFVFCGGLSWVVILGRRAKQGLREMIRLANRPEVKDKFKGKTNGPVQREYRRMGEKGLL